MTWSIVVVVGSVMLVALFAWANHNTAKRHARFENSDVEYALSELLSPDSHSHDTWDLFLSWPINDSYLESIRQRCIEIVRDCPRQHAHEDISQDGVRRVGEILSELRDRT